jgi:hypothetical protein
MESFGPIVRFDAPQVEIAHAETAGRSGAGQSNVGLAEFETAIQVNLQKIDAGTLDLVHCETPSQPANGHGGAT